MGGVMAMSFHFDPLPALRGGLAQLVRGVASVPELPALYGADIEAEVGEGLTLVEPLRESVQPPVILLGFGSPKPLAHGSLMDVVAEITLVWCDSTSREALKAWGDALEAFFWTGEIDERMHPMVGELNGLYEAAETGHRVLHVLPMPAEPGQDMGGFPARKWSATVRMALVTA